MYQCLKHRDYWSLEQFIYSEDEHIEYWMNNTRYVTPEALNSWSNHQLEDQLNKPFFRRSIEVTYRVFDSQQQIDELFILE